MNHSEYWNNRQLEMQRKITSRNEKETLNLLKNEYKKVSDRLIEDFTQLYTELQLTVVAGVEPTPADLYKLDKYWKMQNQIKELMQSLTDDEIKILNKHFKKEFKDIYKAINFTDTAVYSKVPIEEMNKVINAVWCADGKNWSSRVWENTEYLVKTLQEQLVYCVSTGKSTDELKKLLQNRFNVSFHNADTITRTELAHIQVSSAKQRYEDMGIQQVQVWADYDERRCDKCGKLHKKKYYINEAIPIPAHPNCRCSIVPVID